MGFISINNELFRANRARLAAALLPNSLAVVNANDVLPTNADGTLALVPNSDLFYLSGIEQEETLLLLCPDAEDEKQRELLFLREPTAEMQTWEGHKLDKEEARQLSGIARVHWRAEFPRIFHRLMSQCEHVYLNTNEHPRAVVEVETRESRFVHETLRQYPLHDYQRLARLLHRLRSVKSDLELDLIGRACALTQRGFRRVLKRVKPGIREAEVEAEFAHEFIRHRSRFAYLPIIATGANACFLHYISNAATCRPGQLLLLDVGATYGNYNADMTRTIPVSGRFSRRQKKIYQAVLRVLRQAAAALVPGKKPREWQKEAEQMMEKELVELGLITMAQIRKQDPDQPAFKKYFMHGIGHPLGLDVHDVGPIQEPIPAGAVMTVEPGIYLPAEGFAVRLENNVWVTENGTIDLMADIPIEPGEIESLMQH